MTAATGAPFQKLAEQLAAKPGVRNPQGLATAIGKKKYGKERFAQMQQGR